MENKLLTIKDFFEQFPDDEACLKHLWEKRYGKKYPCPSCAQETNWYRIKSERAFSCQWCGWHVHPTVGTPFENTRTALQLWFYAIYLFTTTRHGISAKELQRQLGVTYKTAWRMGHEIRKHMAVTDKDPPLSGVVEVDEAYIGGKKRGSAGRGAKGKHILIGMLQRDGRLITEITNSVGRSDLLPLIEQSVSKGTMIYTDSMSSYHPLRARGYEHQQIKHYKTFAEGDVHINTLEGYWSHLKKSLRGTHGHVSGKHLEKYTREFQYRYNRRLYPERMLPELLGRFTSERR